MLEPGGHLIVTVPDEDLYEQGHFPSDYNRDHKWTFTIHKPKSWSERSRTTSVSAWCSLGSPDHHARTPR